MNRGASYDCDLCGRTFTKAISDEEAWAEYKRRFGVIALPTAAEEPTAVGIVCEDCYGWMFDAEGCLRSEHYGQQPPWTI